MFSGCVISPNVWKQRWIKRAQKYYLEIFGPVVTKEMSVKLLVQRGSKHKQIEGIKLCDKVSACKSNSVYNECLQVSCRTFDSLSSTIFFFKQPTFSDCFILWKFITRQKPPHGQILPSIMQVLKDINMQCLFCWFIQYRHIRADKQHLPIILCL